MKIFPKDGLIEVDNDQRAINLSCTVKTSSSETFSPKRLKWFHEDNEIQPSQHSHFSHSIFHQHQASLILAIHHLSVNHSGVFICVYNDGEISKTVQINSKSSGK